MALFKPSRMRLKFICALFLVGGNTFAEDLGSLSEVHTRFGLVNGTYVGPTPGSSGQFSIISTLDVEYEKHTTTKDSYLLRGIIGYDQTTALLNYFYAGLGQRRYFQSYGQPIVGIEGNDLIRMIPKWRFYGSWDLGISQVLVISRGPVFQTYSTLFDVGINGGVVYQATDRLGVEFQAGYSYGYGFSSVAVVGSTIRALLGISYFLY
jgi:hypothetical protein